MSHTIPTPVIIDHDHKRSVYRLGDIPPGVTRFCSYKDARDALNASLQARCGEYTQGAPSWMEYHAAVLWLNWDPWNQQNGGVIPAKPVERLKDSAFQEAARLIARNNLLHQMQSAARYHDAGSKSTVTAQHREAWSARLRELMKASAEKDRCQVVVQPYFEDYE